MGEDGQPLENGSASSSSSRQEAQAEEAKNAANRDFKGICLHTNIFATIATAATSAQIVMCLHMQLPQACRTMPPYVVRCKCSDELPNLQITTLARQLMATRGPLSSTPCRQCTGPTERQHTCGSRTLAAR